MAMQDRLKLLQMRWHLIPSCQTRFTNLVMKKGGQVWDTCFAQSALSWLQVYSQNSKTRGRLVKGGVSQQTEVRRNPWLDIHMTEKAEASNCGLVQQREQPNSRYLVSTEDERIDMGKVANYRIQAEKISGMEDIAAVLCGRTIISHTSPYSPPPEEAYNSCKIKIGEIKMLRRTCGRTRQGWVGNKYNPMWLRWLRQGQRVPM